MPIFKCRFAGKCAKCGQSVEPGVLVSWSRRHKGIIYHAACVDGADVEKNPPADVPVESESPGSPLPGPTGLTGPHTHREYVTHPQLAHELNTFLDGRVNERIGEEVDHAKLDLLGSVSTLIRETITAKIVLTLKNGTTVRVNGAHENMPKLLYVLSKRQHAYLWGKPGSGKSKAASMAATALQREYGYCSLNPQTPESRLLGFIDAGGTYRRTVFRERFEHGGIMCIDEMDNGHPALLNTLNGMIEPGATLGAFPDGMVTRHEDFVMVCTGNTNGRGGDKMFPERRQLDAAFAERFAFLHWDYDLALERRLTLAQCEDSTKATTWLTWVRAVRTHCEKHAVRLWATPRASMNGASFLHDSSWSVQDVAEAVLFKGLDRDTVHSIVVACPYPTFSAPGADVDPEDV